MRGVQISVNGTVVLTAATTGLIGATLFGLRDGGHRVVASGHEGDEMLLWEGPFVSLGDEVTIKVVDMAGCDPPTRRSPSKNP